MDDQNYLEKAKKVAADIFGMPSAEARQYYVHREGEIPNPPSLSFINRPWQPQSLSYILGREPKNFEDFENLITKYIEKELKYGDKTEGQIIRHLQENFGTVALKKLGAQSITDIPEKVLNALDVPKEVQEKLQQVWIEDRWGKKQQQGKFSGITQRATPKGKVPKLGFETVGTKNYSKQLAIDPKTKDINTFNLPFSALSNNVSQSTQITPIATAYIDPTGEETMKTGSSTMIHELLHALNLLKNKASKYTEENLEERVNPTKEELNSLLKRITLASPEINSSTIPEDSFKRDINKTEINPNQWTDIEPEINLYETLKKTGMLGHFGTEKIDGRDAYGLNVAYAKMIHPEWFKKEDEINRSPAILGGITDIEDPQLTSKNTTNTFGRLKTKVRPSS